MNNAQNKQNADPSNIREQALQLLKRETGIDIDTTKTGLETYAALILKWNAFASLVSSHDAGHLWVHIADSLSLLGLVKTVGGTAPRLLDIGSGGGFPAIPLALALPALEAKLVERSRKKAGFLENVRGELNLRHRIVVQQCTFPNEVDFGRPEGCVITARAVEKPGDVWPGVRELVKNGAVFLCQWPDVPREAEKMFHVEQIIDDWGEKGLRRGQIHVIRNR